MRGLVPFLLLLLVIAIVLRVDFFFTIAYLFLGVYVLSRAWMAYTLRHIAARRAFVNRAFPGDRVLVDVVIENSGRLPVPWLEAHEALPVALTSPPFRREVAAIGPLGRHHIRYTLQCRQRGYFSVGPLTMQTGDLLGVVHETKAQLGSEHIIVYPRVLPLRELDLPTHAPLVALPAQLALFEDPARVMGVRDYERGDSPRRIHWPATARVGRLLVKQYQSAIARGTLICLDLSRESYGQRQLYVATELAIVVAASLANHIVTREKLPAGLATEGRDPLTDSVERFYSPPRDERDHLMGLLEVLARVQIASGIGFVDLLDRETARLSWGATVAVVTGSETEELYDALAYLTRAGFAIALILVQPTQTPAPLRGRAELLGIPVHKVWREHDMEVLTR
jgi:uncharacterized protein (DUF58 family)